MPIAATDVERTAADRAVGVASGLSEEEAARRLAEAGPPARLDTSRSYASIVRANVLTVFNLILAALPTPAHSGRSSPRADPETRLR